MERLPSLGLASNLVPPLEHELTDDGDRFEDSFQFYLDYGRDSATRAATLLESARQHEIETIQNNEATAAAFDAAALSQQEVVSEVCGADRPDAACDVATRTVRLSDVGLPDPGADPGPNPRFGPHSCPGFLLRFVADAPAPSGSSDDQSLIGDYMHSGLGCVRWQTLHQIAGTQVTIPERVYLELTSGGTGEFADAGGSVRQEYVRVFRAVDDLRLSIRHMQATFDAAGVALDGALSAAPVALPKRPPLA